MSKLGSVKFMPLDSYSTSIDTEDTICAVEATSLFGTGSFLDWSRVVGISLNTNYTVGSGALASYRAGYIWLSGGRGGYRTCTINGITFLGGYDYQDGHEGKLIVFPVSKGDVIYATGNVWSFLFIPTVWSL